MTEKEAIKILQELSLERCEAFGFDCGNCDKCKVITAYSLAIKALGLVKQQQAEIERLKSMNQAKLDCIYDLQRENEILSRNADTAFQDGLNEKRDLFEPEIRAEAYKEFAETLKLHKRRMRGFDLNEEFWDYAVLVECIDNLLKELVGEIE